MDGIFFFKSTYVATFTSWENRDHELVTSAATCSRQSWRGCESMEWTDFPVPCSQGISVPNRLWEQELCVWISLVFHFCHFYLLLIFSWHEPFFSYSIWQRYSCSQNTPETLSPCTYFSPLCIKARVVDFPGKDSEELPPYLTAEVNAAMCQPSVWEHWSDQQGCSRAAGGSTPKCLTLKKLRKVSVHVLLTPRVCTQWAKAPVGGQTWDRRWELCSELYSPYGQPEPSLSAWVCTRYLMPPPSLIWIFQECPVEPEV